MKACIGLFVLAVSAAPMFGQQVQMQCRALDNGGYVDQGETIVKGNNGSYMACHPFGPAAQPKQAEALASSPPAAANQQAVPAPYYPPARGFAGSSFSRVEGAVGYEFASGLIGANSYSGNSGRRNGNGIFGELTINANQYFAVSANFDGAYAKNLSPAPYYGLGVPNASYVAYGSYMAGPQVYPMKHGTWSPFARVMFGGTFLNSDYLYALGSPTNRQNGLSFSVGGGMDSKRSERRVGVRLFQFDYSRAWKDGFYLSVFKVGTGFSF